MKIGQMFRYARPYDPKPKEIDGLPNFFHYTYTAGCKLCVLERGINNIASVQGADGKWRTPAILISSSPNKYGTVTTPWKDIFDLDKGYVQYWGDNKNPSRDPRSALGNRVLLSDYPKYRSDDTVERKSAPPLLFFKRVSYGKKIKGHVIFQGCGFITEYVLENNYSQGQSFKNYLFICKLINLDSSNNKFDWGWINDRRDPNLTLSEINEKAPKEWHLSLKNEANI